MDFLFHHDAAAVCNSSQTDAVDLATCNCPEVKYYDNL